ncbi:phage terminase large subunit [Pedobacter africanus]|uniref:Terminase-like family protein n=1 Tax=Pedobacter africanus TaxID=151894 RepID=A0A1W1ZBQ8_9SPHI|nr:phage terminase large subunit [Pedobacter africanus]SMC45869.1 Terminase-like family protein [Pedobacter africanus]
MKLTLKQTRAIDFLEDDVTNDLLFGGGAGGGKSAFGCYWQIKRRLKYPGTRGLIGRAVLKTLKDTTLNTFFQIASLQGLKSNYHYIYNAQRGIITFPSTESEIILKDLATYPSDPNFDELGSLEITDAFVDETNQISKKAWDITKSRIRYKLDDYGLIPKMMGSCNPAKNWVYGDFYKPYKDGSLPGNRQFIQALLSDNPHISKHYRDNLLQLDKNSLERLLHGNWEYDDDPAALMTFNKIMDVFTNTFVLPGEKYITADIARFGSDNTVIGVWSGLRLIRIVTIAKNKVTEAADKIKELCNTYSVPISNVIVDDDGVGGGVVDILGCEGFVNNSSPLPNKETKEPENYNHLKSQCYFKMAELVNKNELFIEDHTFRDIIIQELEQVKQHNMDKDGKKQIIPKDKVKELLGRSPDYSDMIMMRMWFELITRHNFFTF